MFLAPGYIEHAPGDVEKTLDATIEKGIPHFLKILEENPQDARALMFLAQAFASIAPHFGDASITHYMAAMSFYQRRVNLEGTNIDEIIHARLRFLECARASGVYRPHEVKQRAAELVVLAPWHPGVHCLYALATSRLCKVKSDFEELINIADEAIAVAKAWKTCSTVIPVDRTCLWRVCFLAAVAVKLSAGADDPRLAKYVAEGIAAGGPVGDFQKLIVPETKKVEVVDGP